MVVKNSNLAGVRTARASELDFFVHGCSGLKVREYCTPYNVCEGLARMIIYVGLGPMISLLKLRLYLLMMLVILNN